MKFKDQFFFEELILYLLYIIDNFIVIRNYDLLVIWQIDGVYFECVDEVDLVLFIDQFNMLICSFDGKFVIFYMYCIWVRKEV